MAEIVPLFTPGQLVEQKLTDLIAREQRVWLEYKKRTAPLDYEGWPMVWDEATQRYHTSIMGPYGQRAVGTGPYLD